MAGGKKTAMKGNSGAALGFEDKLWVAADKQRGFLARPGETLFIDARNLGTLIDRTHRDLSDEEIAEIGRTYHAWRVGEDVGKYDDKPVFCKAATLKEIQTHGHVLTPGRYVGAEVLDAAIRKNLEALGYGE